MCSLHIATFLAVINAYGYLCLGIPAEKGLIIGTYNPTLLITVKEIPTSQRDYYNNASYPLSTITLPTGITSDPKKKVVFFNIGDTIYEYQNFSIWQQLNISHLSKPFKGRSLSMGQMAFDYVSNNLYWCDSELKWIAMKPAYSDDNAMFKIVVHNNLGYPQGLALDPEDGLMFFSDNKPKSRIEKASMDGTNRSVIVHTGLLEISALSVDATNKLLYWGDYKRHTLEVSNYDGSKRRVLRRMNFFNVSALHYYKNILHAVGKGAYTNQVLGLDPRSGSYVYVVGITDANPIPFSIHVYDAEDTKLYTDPCSKRSCQHMCVNTPSGATCLCAEGHILSADGMTCRDRSRFYEKGFIFSNGTGFFMINILSVIGQQSEIKHLSSSSANIETFAVDMKLHIIYFVDSSSNTLKEFNIITEQPKILASDLNATDLIFDWNANLLGWVDFSQSTIQVFSLYSRTISTIYSGLEQPVSLTVDANNGYLFWISGISTKSILRGNWKNDTYSIIVTSQELDSPRSLYYDVTSHRIYWLNRSLIKSSMIDGSDIKSHSITFGATRAFAYKNYFGWTLGNTIHFARKSAETSETNFTIVPNIKEVTVFDSSLQQDTRGSCHILNGGCEDICIPLQRRRKCQCDLGLKLQPDSTSCDNNVYTTNFIVVTDFTHRRILQIDLNTGNITKLPIIIESTSSIMLDKSTLELYFADISTKTIISTTLHGKNKTVFYSSGFAQISRMAIDYSTGNIYYTARGSTTNENHIGVVKRFSSIHKTLHSNILTPRGIVLYPSKGFMFWTESYAGNVSRIGKSYMDGTLKVYIVTSGLNWPSGLAIDFKTNRLYWTDGYTDRIEYSDLNGGNRHVLTTDADAHLMSIVISGQHLFYTAWNRQRITKLDITTRSKVTFMSKHPELGRLDDLDIFADDTIDVHPICSKRNGECSTFCFPTPNGRTCGCEDDVGLQADQTTCEGVILCPSSIADAVLSSSCSRRAGESCEITCLEENGSHDIVCTSEGTWDQDTRQLCLIKLCPSTLKKGKLHSGCTAKVGNSCLFSCEDGYKSTINSSKIVCTSQGTWNENIEELCKEDKPNFENEWLTGVYIGSSVGGALIIVTLITALICVIKRVKSKSNASKRRPKDGHNSYLEFDNNVFLAYDGSKPYASVYSTIEDMRNF